MHNHIRTYVCILWRQLKSLGSKAVRKVIAASTLGDAIQEANLLHTIPHTKLEAFRQKNNCRDTQHHDIRGLLNRSRKKHDCLIQTWQSQLTLAAQRKHERATRIKINRRRHHTQNEVRPGKRDPGYEPEARSSNNTIKYADKLSVATLNCRGLLEASKREQIVQIMHVHQIDLLALQETKVNSSSEEQRQHEGTGKRYSCFFSSNAQRDAPPRVQPQHANGKAKAQAARRMIEHHGLGFVVGPRLINCIKDCTPHSSRLMEIRLRNHGPDICLINHYAPHSGRPLDEKTQHWDNLQEMVHARSQAIPTFILGDTNARLHGSTCVAEDKIMGRHVFGYGPQHVRTLAESQRDNRQCLVDFCIANHFVVSNTFLLNQSTKMYIQRHCHKRFYRPINTRQICAARFYVSTESINNASRR